MTLSRKIWSAKQLIEIDDPDRYEKSDLKKHLEDAEKANNYRLAIRIQFLMIIKILQNRELIVWRKEKTNTDYILEMNRYEYNIAFKNLVKIFERVWYANYQVDHIFYKGLSLQFDELKLRIEK